MNAKSSILLAALLALTASLRSDTPAPLPPANTPPIEQMIAELKQIDELVKQLDDKNFDKRQEATQKLIRMGKPIVEPLKHVLAAKPNLESTKRIQEILREIKKGQRLKSKIFAQLGEHVNLEKGVDANTPLKDALEHLSDRYELTMIVDANAFKSIGIDKVEEYPVSLPKMVGISLRTVLSLLLEQLKGDVYRATFVVRGDHLLITTTYHADLANCLDKDLAQVPKVYADFDDVEIEDALRELADSTGVSVVIDGRVKEKTYEKVTATLNGVSVDSAVRMLANMAGLKMVPFHNALYVTSPENAKQLEAEKAERQPRKKPHSMPAKNQPPVPLAVPQ